MDKKLKIVAICGSPHKGNTYNILKLLKQSNSEIDFKILMLSELNLMDCLRLLLMYQYRRRKLST